MSLPFRQIESPYKSQKGEGHVPVVMLMNTVGPDLPSSAVNRKRASMSAVASGLGAAKGFPGSVLPPPTPSNLK